MPEVIPLIDPSEENVPELVTEINKIDPPEVWVGCCTTSGEEIASVCDSLRLTIPPVLYPGTVDQILACAGSCRKIIFSHPLFHDFPHIETEKERAYEAIRQINPDIEIQDVCQIVLDTNCSVARILRISEVPDDQIILRQLENIVLDIIYLEGGSGNSEFGVMNKLPLLEQIKKLHRNFTLICSGGITKPEHVQRLADLGADIIVVSTAVHRNPERLQEFLSALEWDL